MIEITWKIEAWPWHVDVYDAHIWYSNQGWSARLRSTGCWKRENGQKPRITAQNCTQKDAPARVVGTLYSSNSGAPGGPIARAPNHSTCWFEVSAVGFHTVLWGVTASIQSTEQGDFCPCSPLCLCSITDSAPKLHQNCTGNIKGKATQYLCLIDGRR